MRVLLVHNHYRSSAPSGERSVIEQEAAGLRDLGHDVARFERHSDEIASWGSLRLAAAPVDALWGLSSKEPLRKALRTFRPDVVHVHNLFPLISPGALETIRRARVPVVATIHNYKLLCASGDFFRDGVPCFECAHGRVAPALRYRCYHGSLAQTAPVVGGVLLHRPKWLSDVSAYIFISAAQQRAMKSLGIPSSRSFVKWNFVPDPTVAASASPARLDQVAFVGRLEPAKGIEPLMLAWDEFCRFSPESRLRLAVVGAGSSTSEVANWASQRKNVDFHGHLPRLEAMEVLGQSRCSVVPSVWHETFGLVAVESMALGVPPVAADRGSFPELIQHGHTGVLVDPGRPSELARVFRQVEGDPVRFAELGRSARQAYVDSFTEDRNLRELVSIYEYAMANPAF